jgi:hypothetical protein
MDSDYQSQARVFQGSLRRNPPFCRVLEMLAWRRKVRLQIGGKSRLRAIRAF